MIFEVWMIFFGDDFFSSLKVYVFDIKFYWSHLKICQKKRIESNRMVNFSYEKTGSLAPSTYRGSLVRLPRVSSKWSPDGHRKWIVTHNCCITEWNPPEKLTWFTWKWGPPGSLEIPNLETIIFRFHVSFRGGGGVTLFFVSWNTLYYRSFQTWLDWMC